MLTLNDGRAELWQWDTGRTLSVDADCSQVHFSNKVFGRSIDVDVTDGTSIIPDVLLQTDKDLNVWAFVGTAENGYTKISKTFKVNRRNKPADYVFTPTDQTSLEEIKEKIDYLESIQAPVQSVNGQTGEVKLTAEDVGAISQDDLQNATNEALAQAKASGEFDGADGADGGFYTPAVTQPNANTMRMSFSPSKEGMPAVAETDITLPSGGGGGSGEDGGYYAPAVDADGNLSWTASKADMPAVDGTNIKGQKGDKGDKGDKGADGKSAYRYAVEGGYTGTEAEFAAKLAAEIPTVDSNLAKSGQAADAAVVGNRLSSLSEGKVTMPADAGGNVQNGTSGQILQTNGDGTTQWVNKPTGGSSSGITDINIKKWVGKKIVIDGSSITAGGTGNTKPVWGSFLKDMFALAECYNHAVPGTGWFFSGNSYVVDRVDSYENDADAVILMGDYNGIYAYTSNAGTIDDAPAADGSYYAKLKYLAEKLITKYPMCPVIWVVEPPRGAQGDGKTPMDYASGYALQSKCIEEVADYYGFTHCNLMKSTIFRPWNETNYAATTSDGTHPWNNIQRTMAQVIAETMKRTPLIYNESYVNTPGDSSGGDSNKTLTKITATFTQGDAVIKTTDELDILRNYLLVVATYSDLSEATVTDYTLSGELTEGTSTITVAYGTATTTFNVNVTLDDGSVTVALGDVIDASLIGYYLGNNTGTKTAREGMRISQYLPVQAGTDITLSGNLTYPNLTNHDIVYYDANKTKSGNANHVYGTVTFTVPDGTSYFRICFDDDDDTKTITYFPG